MLVGKLADGRIVQVLKEKSFVSFSKYQHTLVASKLTRNHRRIEPFLGYLNACCMGQEDLKRPTTGFLFWSDK